METKVTNNFGGVAPKAPTPAKTGQVPKQVQEGKSTPPQTKAPTPEVKGRLGIDEATGAVFHQKIVDGEVVTQLPTETQLKLRAVAEELGDELRGQLINKTV